MNHLSASDAMFLHTESPEMPMHVGSLNVMDLPAGYDGDFYEDAKTHMRDRLHLADVLRTLKRNSIVLKVQRVRP